MVYIGMWHIYIYIWYIYIYYMCLLGQSCTEVAAGVPQTGGEAKPGQQRLDVPQAPRLRTKPLGLFPPEKKRNATLAVVGFLLLFCGL